MPTPIIIPNLGDSIAEATITKWLVEVGVAVDEDDPLLEVSTDKFNVEIPSPSAGILLEVIHCEGETIPVYTVVGIFREEAPLDANALQRYLDQKLSEALATLKKYDLSRLSDSEADEVVRQIVAHFEIESPLLEWQKISASDPHLLEDLDHHPASRTDVMGHRFLVPFQGDSQVLAILAGSRTKAVPPFGGDVPLGFVEGRVFEVRLSIKYQTVDVVSVFKNRRELIEDCLHEVQVEVKSFNARLGSKVRGEAQKIRNMYSEALATLETLAIPLISREGEPDFQRVPLRRKLARPLPSQRKSQPQPEPGIASEDYEHILGVIRHTGRTFEAAPGTFAIHDEPGLRDIVLANLNGHYQGLAAGETFRKKGKTDIRIEDSERAAFVAECKRWRGDSTLTGAIDQLFRYLTWRDCKSSIVIFNTENARFRRVVRKVPQILSKHDQFRTLEDRSTVGEWRCLFSSRTDEEQEITVHVFAFDIFVAS